MSEFDLERLGDVWRQQPDPAEMERLQRTAAMVSRRARWAQAVDVGAAIIVSGIVILLISKNPTKGTFLVGAAAILVLIHSNLRQRRLRQVELRSLTGGTEEMLDQSIERVETTRKRNRLSAIMLPPGLAIGMLFAYFVAPDSGKQILPTVIADSGMRPLFWLAVFALLATVLFLVRSMRSTGRELGRLRTLRDAYRREDQISQSE
jgi:Flp pilus assembly protein TadB